MFGLPFLARSHAVAVCSAVLERTAPTLRQLPNITSASVSKERSYIVSHLRAGLRLSSTCRFNRSFITTGLEVIGWDKGWLMSCACLCLKWSRFAWRQPHSLVPQRQDKVKRAEDQKGCRSCQVSNRPYNSAFSVGVYSLTPKVASCWHIPPEFEDMNCLHIHAHTYYWTLSVEVNGSNFIIWSGSRQIEIHKLLLLLLLLLLFKQCLFVCLTIPLPLLLLIKNAIKIIWYSYC